MLASFHDGKICNLKQNHSLLGEFLLVLFILKGSFTVSLFTCLNSPLFLFLLFSSSMRLGGAVSVARPLCW